MNNEMEKRKRNSEWEAFIVHKACKRLMKSHQRAKGLESMLEQSFFIFQTGKRLKIITRHSSGVLPCLFINDCSLVCLTNDKAHSMRNSSAFLESSIAIGGDATRNSRVINYERLETKLNDGVILEPFQSQIIDCGL